jgi:hypothetical protein
MRKSKLLICLCTICASLLIITMNPWVSLAQIPSQGGSEAVTVAPGASVSLANAPTEKPDVSAVGVESSLGYEMDEKTLQELKLQPYTQVDSLASVDVDSDTSTSDQALAPNILSNFESLDDLGQPDGYFHRPPDPIMAVGPSHVGVMVNSEFAFYTKAGVLVGETSFKSWWSNVYSGPQLAFDPHIVYDHVAGRWLMLALIHDAEPTSLYLLSVSKTSNPLGGWWNYALNAGLNYGGSNTWGDYPDIGFDGIPAASGGAIYITTNQFTWGDAFRTSMLNILPKSALYSGSGFSYWRAWDRLNNDGSQAFTLRTAQTFGNPGAEFLINTKSGGWDKVSLWKVVPTFPPTPVNWVLQTTVTIGAYTVPPDAKQLNSSTLLDTIDNRIYNCMYRNGHVYAAFTEAYDFGTPANVEAAIRYLKINTVTNAADLNVRYGADNQYYWFPAIYTDMSDNIVLCLAHSSTSIYAEIRYTGRKTTDASTQSSALLKAGNTFITGHRWGDFFGIARDPVDQSRVWIYGEWAKDCPGVSSDWDWGTWVGQVSFWPSGHNPTYHFRMNPFADVVHVHLDGTLIHGTVDYDSGGSSGGGYHNSPLLGWATGNTFYMFIDFLKNDDGTPIYYEMGMLVGTISTAKGNLYRTTDGMSWDGPTAVTLSLVTPMEQETLGPSMASDIEPCSGVWPPTIHLHVNPFIDIMHVGVSGSIVNGIQNASGFYANQPVLGALSGTSFYIATDFINPAVGSYELAMDIGTFSFFTASGNTYRTTDGMSWVGPTAITLTPVYSTAASNKAQATTK